MRDAIVCVGNALADGDRAGPDAFALLSRGGPPEGVEVVDGGLSGLALLSRMEGRGRVVFIDSVRGFGAPGSVVVLAPEEAAASPGEPLDHASGLRYLLGVYPRVLEAPPRVAFVGVEEPAGEAAVAEAVRTALAILSEERDVAAPR